MPTTMKLIAKTTLGSSAANIEFTSIPGTYTDLLLVASLRTNRSATTDGVIVRFNGASGDTNLSSRLMYGNGASATSENYSYAYVALVSANTATSSTFGSMELYIPNYAGSTNKSMSSSSASEHNGTTGYNFVGAALWSDTAAITAVKLLPLFGTNFAADSTAQLFGTTKA